jgi:hypothetical protein
MSQTTLNVDNLVTSIRAVLDTEGGTIRSTTERIGLMLQGAFPSYPEMTAYENRIRNEVAEVLYAEDKRRLDIWYSRGVNPAAPLREIRSVRNCVSRKWGSILRFAYHMVSELRFLLTT